MTTDEPRPILVPVDFSESSAEALLWASDLAARLGARLIVLHVIHDLAPGSYVRTEDGTLENYEQAATEAMDEFINRAALEHPYVGSAKKVLVSGIAPTRILEIAAREEAGHIVMGSYGRTGLSHFLLGSKAERVAQLSPIPVTIVKHDQPDLLSHTGE